MKIVKSRRDEVAQLYEEISSALASTVKNAIRIGEILATEKAKCAHGEWGDYFSKHYSDLFSLEKACLWIRLSERKSKFVTVTNLTDCYRQLRIEDKKAPRGKNSKEKRAKVTAVETVKETEKQSSLEREIVSGDAMCVHSFKSFQSFVVNQCESVTIASEHFKSIMRAARLYFETAF